MTNPECRRYEHLLLGEPPTPVPEGWLEHLETCASCRRQWQMHGELVSSFSGLTVPRLASSFDARLGERLARATRRGGGLRRRLMGAYWVAAALVTLLVLQGIEWPTGSGTALWALLFATLGFAFSPLLLLTRRLDTGFVDLLWRTLR